MHTLKTYVPVQGSLAAVKVIRQSHEIDVVLPFEAPNGTLVKMSPTGMPFVGIINGRLTVSLRNPAAPLHNQEYGGRASDFGTPELARAAARQTKEALKALVQSAECESLRTRNNVTVTNDVNFGE